MVRLTPEQVIKAIACNPKSRLKKRLPAIAQITDAKTLQELIAANPSKINGRECQIREAAQLRLSQLPQPDKE